MPFPSDAIVDVEQLDDKSWKLHRALRYVGKQEAFEAPRDMATDFASVPRVFVWLLPRYGRYTKAAIIHDHLWRDRPNNISLHDADALFRRAMRESDVAFLRRWVMWTAVRWGALKKGGVNREWLTDLPVVLLFTLIVLPIVLPPALVILIALVAFWVMEALVWVVLLIAKVLGRRMRPARPEKEVNAPDLSLSL